MSRRDPASIFFGPHRRFDDLAAWPPTIQLHLQLFGLLPGALATPPLPPEIFLSHILTPSGSPGLWLALDVPIIFAYFHTPVETYLDVSTVPARDVIFRLNVPFAIDRWAYNSITDPAGVFAFGGSATSSWQEP